MSNSSPGVGSDPAEVSRVSVCTLSKAFRERYGMGFMGVLKGRRLKVARGNERTEFNVETEFTF